jgi:DNA invertase Pin-like site-specific DNA recombinase
MQQSSDDEFEIGYARVSTAEQNLTHQIDALVRHGIPRKLIYTEKVSGAAKHLPERAKAIKQCMRPGATLVVWKLDRLGRSMREVVNIAHELDRAGAFIRTLDGVDTRNPMNGKLLLGMLAIVAEFERSMISARTKSAMAAQKARGAKYGGKVKFTPVLLKKIAADLKQLGPDRRPLYTVAEVAKRHGVSPSGINLHLPKSRSKLGKTSRGRPPRKRR